ncbi:molybdopterin-dependent oxidoreductase [Herbaspirillum robiniae]|uniref:molybdopterin-dependent oxidoreductase n=1 Tax=Herbaspirillum robiniae TaxID=2014887 RepID=UPI003D77D979
MTKRNFLRAAASALAATAALPAAAAPRAVSPGPVLLTVTGEIARPNRGPIDHALDQMMHKQKLEFDRAHAFDFAALAALPAVEIRPTLEYDGKRHALRGPLLADVMRAAGADPKAEGYVLRAIDGYAVMVSREDALKYRFIVATHLDGKPMPLGGLGPLWAVYEADAFPDMAARPVSERFGLCPWGIYHIAVRKA